MSTPPAVTINAQALIAQAIERGTDPVALGQLVTLGERLLAIEARQAWVAAMTRAQEAFPSIAKTEEGKTKSYTYKYADLDQIDEKIKPVLHKWGLVMTWQYDSSRPGEVGANCRLTHALGHHEDSGFLFMPIEAAGPDGRGASPAQRAGIAATYARRYSCCAVTGIVPHGEDVDGKAPTTEGAEAPEAPVLRPDGAVLVTGVEERSGNKTAGGRWVKWVVSFDDGTAGDTWTEGMAERARRYQAERMLVLALLETKGRYTNLLSLDPPETLSEAQRGFEAEIDGLFPGVADPQGDGARDAVHADETHAARVMDTRMERDLANAAVVAYGNKLKLKQAERELAWETHVGTEYTPATAPIEKLGDLVRFLKAQADALQLSLQQLSDAP